MTGGLSPYVQPRTIRILLIEDNPGDVRLTREVLNEAKIANELLVAPDGETGMSMLRDAGNGKSADAPELVLLDLNLPRKSGIEILRECKADPKLRRVPVVVLSSSAAERDILRSYDLHANAYVTKPIDLDQFIGVVRAIEHFWLAVVTLPPR